MPWHIDTRALTSFSCYPDTYKPRYWISRDLKKTQPIYLKIILIKPGIIWSLKFKKKRKNGRIAENIEKIIRNQDTYFVVIMNNHFKIISVATWCSPLKYGRIFSSFSWGDKNFFGQKNYGEVVLNWRTNDQIMPRFGRSFINDKCIFQ